MECPACKTELTELESGCLRCLRCKPLPKENKNPVVKPDNKKVDQPWTEERIRTIVRDELEDWHKATTVHTETGKLKLTEVAVPDKVDWRGEAKKLGIKLTKDTGGAKKKDDVLAEIAGKTKSPE
jgi:hypothetical protein